MGPVGQPLSSVAVSPDNQFVLAGGQSGLLQMWRLATGAFVYAFSGPGGITEVRFTPSGFAFYAGRTDGTFNTNSTVRIYRTSDHTLLETYSLETSGFGNNPSGPLALDVSADGKHFSYGRDDATVVMSYNTLIAAPTSATLFRGQLVSGSFQDLVMADGVALVARSGLTIDSSPPVQVDIGAHSPLPNPTGLSFQIVTSASIPGLQQEVWMRNAQSGTLELVDARPATTAYQSVRINLGPNFSRFIDAAGNLMARVKWSVLSPIASNTWQVSVDQAVWPAGL
jgi:WD40 repeat protein